MPSIDSSSPTPAPSPETSLPTVEHGGDALKATPAGGQGLMNMEAPKTDFTAFGDAGSLPVARTAVAEVNDFTTAGPNDLSASRAATAPKGAAMAELPALDAGQMLPSHATSAPMMPSHTQAPGVQQNLDPERGLRQQMTQGGPDRTNSLTRTQGGPETPTPEPGQAITAAKLDQPQVAPSTQSGLNKVMDWVKENPVLTAAIVAAATYALQSQFSKDGGSILGAAKYGAMAWGVVKAGGALLGGNDSPDQAKKDEPGMLSRLGDMAKSAIGVVIPSYGATRMVSSASDAMKSSAAPAPGPQAAAGQIVAPKPEPTTRTI